MGLFSVVKRFARAVVPHIIVLSLLFGYLIFGAVVFSFLEGGHSDVEMYNEELDQLRDRLMHTKLEQGHPAGPGANGSARPTPAAELRGEAAPSGSTSAPGGQALDEVVDEMIDRSLRPEWKLARMQAVQSKRAWTFASSMLFSLTTITTIGYGDVVPVTVGGKTFCVIYSVFGIPLTMLYLGGVGSFLAHIILTLCKILHLGQPIRKAVCPCGSGGERDRYDTGEPRPAKGAEGRSKAKKSGKGTTDGPAEEAGVVTAQHGVEAGHGDAAGPEDEMEAPVLLVVAIMTGYMCAGAFLMHGIEEWSYGEALYFTFITLTTIGFGDYVPMMLYKEDAFFVCIVYALFGLAVMSMCIALMQAKVRRVGNRFWRCIGC